MSGAQSDALVYALSGVFALGLGFTSREPAQWHWGYLAAPTYLVAALVAFVIVRLHVKRALFVRVALLALVVLGAVAIPLGLEARWRHLDPGAAFAQPEVSVIERSAQYLSRGQDPYRAYMHNGHVVDALKGVPAYESFFPYFPLMGVFGLPSAETHKGAGLTDARIVMSLMTMIASAMALALLRVSRETKVRIFQILVALPTGALFLSTGGDDMPILALMLLGVAGLQRRSNYVAGVSIGLAAAMKLTAWPLAAGALLVARTREGRSGAARIAVIVATIVLVTVIPFAAKDPWSFVSNVFAFPLGLAGVRSPAASPLPGHILTTIWSPMGHILAPLALLVMGYFAWRYVRAHWPINLSQMLGLLAVAFSVMILSASATRIGYLIYPLNLAVWSYSLAVPPAPARVPELV
jgi:Glycosyltransferase family 87